jgi:hypothetical protein
MRQVQIKTGKSAYPTDRVVIGHYPLFGELFHIDNLWFSGYAGGMFNGFSTTGAIALHLARDYHEHNLKSATRYNLDQLVEKVCIRRETVAAMGRAPSYIWWHVTLSEGEPLVKFDRGKLASVWDSRPGTGPRKYRYVAVEELESDTLLEGFFPQEWCWSKSNFTKIQYAMLTMGLAPYQWVLSRYREEWSTDYYGEDDSMSEHGILYVEPLSGPAYLPVVLDMVDIRPNFTRSLSLA